MTYVGKSGAIFFLAVVGLILVGLSTGQNSIMLGDRIGCGGVVCSPISVRDAVKHDVSPPLSQHRSNPIDNPLYQGQADSSE